MQLRDALKQQLPGVQVVPQRFPPPMHKQALSSLIQHLQENKLPMAGMAWFMGGSLSASMLKTGAFEVAIRADDAKSDAEDERVWSGIAHGGRPPATHAEMAEIIDALRAAFRARASEEDAALEGADDF